MGSKFIRNKHLRRKRKGAADKRRRIKLHRKRVVALGATEDQASKMNTKELRDVLRHPKKAAKRLAKK